MVTKSDKGNNIVILNKSSYIEKIGILLSDHQVYEKLNSNPLKDTQRAFNNQLKDILGHNVSLIEKFRSKLPCMPYLYGLPKLHKEGTPFRPIISTVQSISYSLSKYLATSLSQFVGKISSSHIVNSEHFVNSIRNVNLNGKKLVSFDIVSLFTNVPLDSALTFLNRFFSDEREMLLPLNKTVFFKLLKLALSINHFSFNGNYYKQNFGLSMGNPLSPVLSNLFLECMEKYLMNEILNENIVWMRYVDDVFAILPNECDVNEFLAKINALCPTIKFTVENEGVNGLPFLDVFVSRSEMGFPCFKVYRKQTHTNNYIHAFSGHCESVKKGVISGLFLRALR
ncbi:unnamed protein product, partial [Rotaria socialis]